MRAPRPERGSFLLFAVVSLMILLLVFEVAVRTIFGDYMLAAKASSAETNRQRALGLEAQAMACLDGTGAAATCDATPAISCLAPLQADGVTITLSGTPPRCKLTVSIPGT